MKLTVTYEVSGKIKRLAPRVMEAFIAEILRGPLRTGLDAANAQLEAENKKLRLKLVNVEVE